MPEFYSRNECLLCDELGRKDSHSIEGIESVAGNEKIIFESKSFVFLRDICPLVPGHSLLIPKKHYSNFGQLSRVESNELREIKRECISLITGCFSAPLLFEHGSKIGELSNGACVTHAHIHFIPLQAPVNSWLKEAGKSTSHAMVFPSDALRACATRGYLACEEQDGGGRLLHEISSPLPCQFIRRRLARHFDLPTWNWKAAFQNTHASNQPPCIECHSGARAKKMAASVQI